MKKIVIILSMFTIVVFMNSCGQSAKQIEDKKLLNKLESESKKLQKEIDSIEFSYCNNSDNPDTILSRTQKYYKKRSELNKKKLNKTN